MDVFNLTKEDLEDALDQAKAVILLDLVHVGLLTIELAEDYAMKHTIILKKKNFFRTITDRWKKCPEHENYCLVVVGNNSISSTAAQPQNEGKGILTSILDRVLREHNNIPYDGPTVSG